jgi:hypothetical protein
MDFHSWSDVRDALAVVLPWAFLVGVGLGVVGWMIWRS